MPAPAEARPVDWPAAEARLRAGRQALRAGDRAGAMEHFRAAMAHDPAVACLPWGLLPHLQAEGRGTFRLRMQARLESWYRPGARPEHAAIARLSRKPEMRAFVADLGLPLPRLLAGPVALGDVPWADLPETVVIKPENDGDSRGVILAQAGHDRMARTPIEGGLEAYVRARHGALYGDRPQRVLVEEALVDVEAARDPALVIPRDFKVYCVAGHAGLVRIHDRNAPDGRRGLLTCDRAGRIQPLSHKHWPEAPHTPPPPGWERLIGMAEALSRALPWLLRLDFYLTPEGPVFGEFTTYPNAGRGLTPHARRTLLQMWELHPDEAAT